MKNSKLSSTLVLAASILLLITILFAVMSTYMGAEEKSPPCIEEVLIWDFETNNTKEMWIIRGEKYLVKESPRGHKEIVGKISRHTTNYKRIPSSK